MSKPDNYKDIKKGIQNFRLDNESWQKVAKKNKNKFDNLSSKDQSLD